MNGFIELAKDDSAVKFIFDHVRNLALAAAAFSAAAYILEHPDRFALPPWIAVSAGAVIMVVAGFLTVLNALHGLLKTRSIKSPFMQVLAYLAVNISGPFLMIVFMLHQFR